MYIRIINCPWTGESSVRKMGTTKNMVKAPKSNLSDFKVVTFQRQPKSRLKRSHLIMSDFSLDEKSCVENVAGLKISADTISIKIFIF